jgi:hypothetical protein
VPQQRRQPDPGLTGDVAHRRVDALFGDDRAGDDQQAVAIGLGIRPHLHPLD